MRDTVSDVSEESRKPASNQSGVTIRRILPLALAATLLLGCGDDDGEASSITAPPDTTTSTTERSTTITTEGRTGVEADVEEAYYAQWDAYVEILSDPDPSNRLIDQHFAGAAKETLLDSISKDIRDGVVTRLPENKADFAPRIESIDVQESKATVLECVVDGLVAVRRSTGEVLDDDVVVLRLTNEFELLGGQWKIIRTEVVEELTDRSECAG